MQTTEKTTEETQDVQPTPGHVIDDPAKAINVLVNAAEHAARMGAFTIQESKIIYDSIVFFRPDRSFESVNSVAQQEQQEQ